MDIDFHKPVMCSSYCNHSQSSEPFEPASISVTGSSSSIWVWILSRIQCCSMEPTANTVPQFNGSPYFSPRIQSLVNRRSEFENKTEFDIEASTSHWTELSKESNCDADDDEYGKESSREIYERLKKHPEWGLFFRREEYQLEIGRKIGEGGQAEVFEALGKLPGNSETQKLVVKVFDKAFRFQVLQKMWPDGLLKKVYPFRYFRNVPFVCWPVGAQLLKDDRFDDRFAFVFPRKLCDLRKRIDDIMIQRNCIGPPYELKESSALLTRISYSMQQLHNLGFLHKDLKASNVLLDAGDAIHIADFESSVATVGTGFWRAPEVLFALRNGGLKADTFTEESDVYSFAMVCYEVLTGRIPFEGHPLSDYDVVLRGERPALPDDLPADLKDLVCRCWHSDPLQRPPFGTITRDLDSFRRNTLGWKFHVLFGPNC